MPDTKPRLNSRWTLYQAMTLVGACLIAGVAGGRLIRSAGTPAAPNASPLGAVASEAALPASQPVDAAQLRTLADAQAEPLLRKLQMDPRNPDVLTSLGNLYYDAQQYSVAVDDYGRALESRPSDVAVRTDMATAWWYMGDTDRALTEFNRALVDQPNYPNALFNRGVVRWLGKGDATGALADWRLLLATNPNYQARDQVEQLIARVRKDAGAAAQPSR
jgi:tetratricopeptide (TPR) repeat protein